MAVMRRDNEERAYRYYVASSLQLMPQGKFIAVSLQDMLEPKPDFDPDEVVEHVISHF